MVFKIFFFISKKNGFVKGFIDTGSKMSMFPLLLERKTGSEKRRGELGSSGVRSEHGTITRFSEPVFSV